MDTNHHFAKGSSQPSSPHDSRLVLYSMRFCPFAHRVHLVLNAKDIPYHVFYINLTDKPEWYTANVNPNGKVPALQLTNEPYHPFLVESMVICEYLDEKYPENKLYPTDPLAKANTKLWIERIGTVAGSLYRLVYEKNADDVIDKHFKELFATLDQYEEELKKRGTEYYGGDKPNILDYAIWPWFERFGLLSSIHGDKNLFDANHYPQLTKWVHVFTNDAAVQKHHLSTYTHTKFSMLRRDGNPDYNILEEEA